jgi:hypothetical protein
MIKQTEAEWLQQIIEIRVQAIMELIINKGIKESAAEMMIRDAAERILAREYIKQTRGKNR